MQPVSPKTELWFTEKQGENCGFSIRVKKQLVSDKTQYQSIEILETYDFGRLLLLDGMVMLTERDEFVYHDMMTHVPSNLLKYCGISPEKALVIGGGDGGTVRELLKNDSLKQVTLCEIDEKVVSYCQKFFPTVSCGLKDSRVEVRIGDGVEYLKSKTDEFDLICVDSTDPVGPAVGLFSLDFYQSVFKALKPHGIMTAQAESFFLSLEFLKKLNGRLKAVFPHVSFYKASIPTYPTGTWCFCCGSKEIDPSICRNKDFVEKVRFQSRYYNSEIHKAAFALPTFFCDALRDIPEEK